MGDRPTKDASGNGPLFGNVDRRGLPRTATCAGRSRLGRRARGRGHDRRRHRRRGDARAQEPRPGRAAGSSNGWSRSASASEGRPALPRPSAVGALIETHATPSNRGPGQADPGEARRPACRCRCTITARSTGSSSQGTAPRIRRGGEVEIILTAGQSTYHPARHRGIASKTPGQIPLRVIEVQSGAYLDEDDIVRREDHCSRD